MKLIKTNKDVVFIMFLFVWVYLGIVIAFYTDIDVWIYNLLMTSLFGIMTLLKFTNKFFRNWLEKEI